METVQKGNMTVENSHTLGRWVIHLYSVLTLMIQLTGSIINVFKTKNKIQEKKKIYPFVSSLVEILTVYLVSEYQVLYINEMKQ